MPEPLIHIEVQGIDKIQKALERFPRQIARYLGMAGQEAAGRVIFPTVGIKRYPPRKSISRREVYGQSFESEKQRRWFFAALKEGRIDVPYRRGQSPGSERLCTQWYATVKGFSTEIGNRASYASLVVGEEQSRMMAARGWRRLVDVVSEEMRRITAVYQAWVDKLIRDLGL